jgi:hypothetical protein
MVDLDTHRIVDLIASRDKPVVSQWLRRFSQIKLAVRDGAVFFSTALANAGQIIQVSDRFHYLRTVLNDFKQAIMHLLPTQISLMTNPADTQVPAGQLPWSWQKIQQNVQLVRRDHQRGLTEAEISRHTGLTWRAVNKYLTTAPQYHPRRRFNALMPYAKQVQQALRAGQAPHVIFQKIVKQGYPRKYQTFLEYRHQVSAWARQPTEIARTKVAHLLFQRRGAVTLTPALKVVFDRYPMVKTLLSWFCDFWALSEYGQPTDLYRWLAKVTRMHNRWITAAYTSIKRDEPAIVNSLIFRQYSNGPVEGKNTKTKLVKRGMFGRCNFNTLRTKLLLLEKFQ